MASYKFTYFDVIGRGEVRITKKLFPHCPDVYRVCDFLLI